MPVVVAVQVWFWMTNFQNGILNYVLTTSTSATAQHDWYATTFSKLALVTALIVWGAIPFVVVTVYAGLAQVPASSSRRRRSTARAVARLRDVTFPILKPIFLILTSLSIIWDFGVFTQPFLLIGQSNISMDNYLMGIYLFEEAYLKSDFGRGAAISILMLLMVAALSVVYVRRWCGWRRCDERRRAARAGPVAVTRPAAARRRGRRRRRAAWNVVGLVLLVVLVFPVFWMVTTALKPDDEINSFSPRWLPLHPTLDHFRDAIAAPYFWDGVKNSLIIVGARWRSRWCSRSWPPSRWRSSASPAASLFIVLMIGIQMLPSRADHPALRRARPLPPGEHAHRRDRHVHDVRPALLGLALRGFILGIPRELEEAAMVDGSTRVGAFVRILLPLVAPGLVATSVFAFITCWNEYIFARILLSDQANQTATVWLSYFYGTSGTPTGAR